MHRILILALVLLLSNSNLPGQPQERRELYPVCKEGRSGYIYRTGKFVINLQFDEAYDFSDGLARVAVGNKFGFIDTTGRMVIPPRFGMAREFTEGLAAVTESEASMGARWGYIDKSGRMVIIKSPDSCERRGITTVCTRGRHDGRHLPPV